MFIVTVSSHEHRRVFQFQASLDCGKLIDGATTLGGLTLDGRDLRFGTTVDEFTRTFPEFHGQRSGEGSTLCMDTLGRGGDPQELCAHFALDVLYMVRVECYEYDLCYTERALYNRYRNVIEPQLTKTGFVHDDSSLTPDVTTWKRGLLEARDEQSLTDDGDPIFEYALVHSGLLAYLRALGIPTAAERFATP